ncbi:MAG: hypothetical protein ACJ75M_24040, partial [Actinomycetes bacterium]
MATAGTVIREAGHGKLGLPRRVVLLSASEGLAALLKSLLGGGILTTFASLRGADDVDGLSEADTVVLDLTCDGDGVTVAQVRHRYRGELVVLTARRQRGAPVAPDPACTILELPFSAMALGTALGLSMLGRARAPAPAIDRHQPVAGPRPPGPATAAPADLEASAQQAPSWVPPTAAG